MLRVSYLLGLKSRDVWTISPEAPVLEAIRVMAERGIGALPVVKDGQVVGIVSERDYARKVILRGRSSAETPVRDIMSSPVIAIGPDQAVPNCMELMTEHRIRHLPVIEKSRLIGMISIGDIVKAVMEEQQQTIAQLERYIAS